LEMKEKRWRLGAMGRTNDKSEQDKQRVEKINEIHKAIPVWRKVLSRGWRSLVSSDSWKQWFCTADCYGITACSRTILEKLIVSQSRNSPSFVKLERKLPCSQELASGSSWASLIHMRFEILAVVLCSRFWSSVVLRHVVWYIGTTVS
jgi:hypothetical protein